MATISISSNKLEAPRKRKIPERIKKLAFQLNLNLTEISVYDLDRDFLDICLFIYRQYITYTVEGDKSSIEKFNNELNKTLNGTTK